MFIFVVVVAGSLSLSPCFAAVQQHHTLAVRSMTISETDFASYFNQSFSTNSMIECASKCCADDSVTSLYTLDTNDCSCHDHISLYPDYEGRTIYVMQEGKSSLQNFTAARSAFL